MTRYLPFKGQKHEIFALWFFPWFILWSSCILTPLYSLTGPLGQPFASSLGGQWFVSPGMHPHFWNWDSTVSNVSLHWWPQCDPWSPVTIGPLTLATSCFSHPSCPSSYSHWRPQINATYRWGKPQSLYCGGSPVELSSFILTPLHSLTGPVGQPFASHLGGQQFAPPGMNPHFWNWDSPTQCLTTIFSFFKVGFEFTEIF
jgi:hypothetical protein